MTDCTIIYYPEQKHKHNFFRFREKRPSDGAKGGKGGEKPIFLFALPVYKRKKK